MAIISAENFNTLKTRIAEELARRGQTDNFPLSTLSSDNKILASHTNQIVGSVEQIKGTSFITDVTSVIILRKIL